MIGWLRRLRWKLGVLTNRYVGSLLPAKRIYLTNEMLADDYELVPCWCGDAHPVDFWHDPTHGRIDRDIQDKVQARYGDDLSLAQRVAIEDTIQNRRDRGLSI